MKNKKYLFTTIIGIISGIALFFSPGTFFILLLGLISCFFINLIPEKSERKFLLNIFLIGFISRLALTTLIAFLAIAKGKIIDESAYGFPGRAPYIFYDSGYYTLRALWMSYLWTGVNLGQAAEMIAIECGKYYYGFHGLLHVLAIFFILFGYSPISSIFINCFLGTLSAILTYFIAKEIFSVTAGRLSAILTVFFPSLFLWSITNLKDTTFIFLVCIMLWSFIRFQKTKKKKIFYIVLVAVSVWFQSYFHKQLLIITAAMVLFSLFWLFISNISPKRKAIAIIATVVITGLIIFFKQDKIKSLIDENLQSVFTSHKGFITTGGICYKLLPDEVYTTNRSTISFTELVKMLRKGWIHFMFEPFPWRMESKSLLAAYPQMALWYFLTPFAIFGMLISMRYKLKESILLVVYFLTISSILAVTEGNVGTTFRHRDAITPAFLIFGSIGLIKVFNFSMGIHRWSARLEDKI